jgi:hypothetical protein
VDRRGARSGHDVGLAGARLAVGDVVFDGVVEQHRILRHDADRVAQRLLRHVAQVLAVDGDAAAVDVVEAEQQARHGRLAEPLCPTTAVVVPAGMVKSTSNRIWRFVLVAEVHVRNAPARHCVQRLRIGVIGHFAVLVQQREQALHVGQALLDFAVDHAEEVERNVQLDHEGVDQHQVAQVMVPR